MILANAVIKGYHAFQIKPPKTSVNLTVDREYTNKHDENACLVWLPPLDNFPEHMHSEYTDTKRQLKLEDIAWLPVGHVPRPLAGHFRTILDEGGQVFAQITGEPVPSFPPWPAPKEEGGGVVIPCNYRIVLTDSSLMKKHYDGLSALINSIPEVSVLCLTIQEIVDM